MTAGMLPLLLLLSTLAAPAQIPEQPRLLAGPDVLVSSENDFPHLEMTIAAHPTDPRHLTAGSIVLVGKEFGTMVYSSADGGTTWSPGYPAERIYTDADPLVLYTPRGTVLYLALPSQATPRSRWTRARDGSMSASSAAGRPPVSSSSAPTMTAGPSQRQNREQDDWAMVSRDGGETFSEPVFVGKQAYPPKSMDEEHFAHLHSFPQMAAGGDRIYMALTDFRSGRPQVMLTSSADLGKTWSEPRPVAGPLPEGAYSFQPALAVNKDGVLGVSWLDTRAHPGTNRYDAWFSASLDGGVTFLPAVRLSSESSDPLGAGNHRPSPGTFRDGDKTIRVAFLTALTRFPQGGDYAGLAADAEGHFHPLWPDSRTGTFQAWTASVTLERGPASPALAAAGAALDLKMDLKDHIEVMLDMATYDGETRELLLPIRIRNRSEKDHPRSAPGPGQDLRQQDGRHVQGVHAHDPERRQRGEGRGSGLRLQPGSQRFRRLGTRRYDRARPLALQADEREISRLDSGHAPGGYGTGGLGFFRGAGARFQLFVHDFPDAVVELDGLRRLDGDFPLGRQAHGDEIRQVAASRVGRLRTAELEELVRRDAQHLRDGEQVAHAQLQPAVQQVGEIAVANAQRLFEGAARPVIGRKRLADQGAKPAQIAVAHERAKLYQNRPS